MNNMPFYHPYILVVCIVVENILYYLVTQTLYLAYIKTESKKVSVIRYQLYKTKSKSFISNWPTVRGKEFYKTLNKVTIVFNVMILATFILFLVVTVFLSNAW